MSSSSSPPIPEKGTLEHFLTTHDISHVSICDFRDNRFSIDNFFDKERQKLFRRIYCWKGVIEQNRGTECTIGTICSPYSYADARTRFCLTWGCKDPFLFVADDRGEPVRNDRGGIIVFSKKEECEGAFVQKINCFIGGIKQSLDSALDPANRKELLMQMGILAIIFVGGAIMLARFRASKNRRVAGFRRAVTPRFQKTQPLFPRSGGGIRGGRRRR